MEVLSKLLEDLNSALDSNDATVDLASLVESIEAIGTGELDDAELETCTNIFLYSQSPPSLLQFLTASLRAKDRDVIRAKVYALKFLAGFIKRHHEYVSVYAEKVAVDLIQLFKKEDSGEVKAALLLPFKNIMRKRIQSLDEKDASALVVDADPDAESDPTAPFDLETFPLENVFQTLIDEIRYNKKMSKGVHREALTCLGVLVGVYPTCRCTVSLSDTVLDLCDSALKSAFNSKGKDPDFPAIAGAFSCIDKCLYHFDSRHGNSVALWKHLLQAAQTSTNEEVSRFAAAGKAIKLIKNHAQLFYNIIGINAQTSYDIVVAAHKSGKEALAKHSEGALQALLASLSSYLLHNQNTESKASLQAGAMVNGLLSTHLKKVQDAEVLRSSSDEMVVALQGLLSLSPAIPPFLQSNVLGNGQAPATTYSCADLIKAIVEVAEHYNRYQQSSRADGQGEAAQGEGGNNQSAYLIYRKSLFFSVVVSYLFGAAVQCLSQSDSSMVEKYEQIVTEKLLRYLEEFGTDVLVGYIKLYKNQQRFIRSAMSKLLILRTIIVSSAQHSERSRLAELNNVIGSLLDILFLRTITRSDVNDYISPDHVRLSTYNIFVLEDRLVYVYSSLWSELMQVRDKTLRMTIIEHYDLAFLDTIRQELLNYLVHKSIDTMKTLQLSYSNVDSENMNSNVDIKEVCYLPENILDQDLFLNLVTFLEIVITNIGGKDMFQHMDVFLSVVVELSQQLPLLSGFYKLVACYLATVEDTLVISINTQDSSSNIHSLVSSLIRYIVVLQENMITSPNDYNNELLHSIVKMIFSVPIECVAIETIYATLQISLSSNIHLLKCVSILDKYFVYDSKRFLAHALPLLRLLNKFITPLNESGMKANEQLMYMSVGRKKLKTQLHSSNVASYLQKQQLATKQILIFLGKLGQHNKALLTPPAEIIRDSLVWSMDTNIPFSLTVGDKESKLEVMLDKILPIITGVCAKQIDLTNVTHANRVKELSAAAETLYNVMIYMIANSSSHSCNYSDYYRRLFPVIFMLASHSKVNMYASLFDNLLHQMISYLTSANHRDTNNGEYTSILLESLIESIVETNDNNLKELCSTLFTKYLQCCIKGNIKITASNATINIKHLDGVLDQLCILLSHPLEKKQRAGLLILSKAYKFIRMELVIVRRYGMYLLFLLLKLLSLSRLTEENEKSLTALAVKFEEMLVYYSIKYRDESELLIYQEYRHYPRSLHELLQWLWQHILLAPIQKSFRRTVLRIFMALIPLLRTNSNGSSNSKQSLTDKVMDYIEQWKAVLDKDSSANGHKVSYINQHLNQKLNKDGGNSIYIAVLDIYNWFITMSIIQPLDLIINSHSADSEHDCLLFNAIQQLLDKYINTGDSSKELADAFLRTIIFLTNLLIKCNKADQVFQYLQRVKICGNRLYGAALSFVIGRHNIDNQNDTSGAICNFIQCVYSADNQQSVHEELSALMSSFITSQVQQLCNASMNPAQTNKMQTVQSLCQVIKTLGKGQVVLNHVVLSSAYKGLADLTNSLSTNSTNNYAVHVGREILSILFEVNLPLYNNIFSLTQETQSDQYATSQPCVISLLSHPHYGAKIYHHFSDVIAEAIATSPPTTSLSFLSRDNLLYLVSNTSQSITKKLLEDVLNYIAAHIMDNYELINYITYTMIPLLENFDFSSLSHAFLLLLVTIFAQITTLSGHLCECRALRQYMVREACNVFSKPKDMEKITQALQWLPYILPGCTASAPRPLILVDLEAEKKEQGIVQDCLEELVSERFPLDSAQLPPASSQGKEFLLILESYLQSFQQCGSLVMLCPLYPSLREGRGHVYYQLFVKAFGSLVHSIPMISVVDSKQANWEKQFIEVKYVCNFCLTVIYDDYQDISIKRCLVEHLFLPTILSLSSQNMIMLFALDANKGLQVKSTGSTASIVKVLYDILAGEVIPPSIGQDALLSHIYMVTIAYKLFTMLYDHCYVNDVKTLLTAAYVNGDLSNTSNITGKELTQAICRVTFKFTHTQMNSIPNYYAYNMEGVLKDTLYELYAAAYTCLVTIVCKTQTEETFYDNFIFKQKSSEDIFGHVLQYPVLDVDKDKSIFSAYTKKFDNVKLCNNIYLQSDGSTVCASKQDSSTAKVNRLNIYAKKGIRKGGYVSQYIHNTMLSNSQIVQPRSLSHRTQSQTTSSNSIVEGDYTISQYDYANVSSSINPSRSSTADYNLPLSTNPCLVSGWDDQLVYLELNHINTISVMGTLVRSIQRMHIAFREKWSSNTNTMPSWLKECYDCLVSSKHQKVQMFFLRLFINQPVASIIHPWVHLMMPGLVERIHNLLCQGHEEYHYILRDVVFTFCDIWKDIAMPPSCLQHAGSILNFIISHLTHEDPDVLKENVLGLCTLLPSWLSLYNTDNTSNCYNTSLPYVPLNLDHVNKFLSTAYSMTGGAHGSVYSKGSISVRYRSAALEVLLCLLRCNYPLFIDYSVVYNICSNEGNMNTNGTSKALMQAILDNLALNRKEIIESSCNVVGRIMNLLYAHKLQNKQSILYNQLDDFMKQANSMIEGKAKAKNGIEMVIYCYKCVLSQYSHYLKKDMVYRTLLSFNAFSFQCKYNYLEVFLMHNSIFLVDDSDEHQIMIIELIRPYLKALLADVNVLTLGRGAGMVKVPILQIYTLLLVTKHIQLLYRNDTFILDQDRRAHHYAMLRDVIISLIGKDEAEGVRFCINSNSHVSVRYAAYNLLISIYTDRDKIFAGPDSDGATLLQTIVQLLLNGLNDTDGDINRDNGKDSSDIQLISTGSPNLLEKVEGESIKQYLSPQYWNKASARMHVKQLIYEFFHNYYLLHNIRTREGLHGYVMLLCKDLFDISNVQNWMVYAPFLLLSTILQQQNNHEKLFNLDLLSDAEANFQPFSRFGTQALSSMMVSNSTPLFALERTSQNIQALASQSPSLAVKYTSSLSQVLKTKSFANTYDAEERNVSYFRGTQQVSWTQAMSRPTSTAPGTAYPTQARVNINYNTFMQPISSTVSNIGSTTLSLSSQGPGNNGANTQLGTFSMAPPTALPRYITTQRVPLRFTSSNSKQQARTGIINKMMYKKSISKEENQHKELNIISSIDLHSAYRTGEVPDISVTVSHILKPLQSLCLHNPSVSTEVLYWILTSLYSNALSEQEGKEVVDCLCRILEQCQLRSKTCILIPIVLQVFIDLISHGEYILLLHNRLPDSMLCQMAMDCGCVHLAIRYFEKKLSTINTYKFMCKSLQSASQVSQEPSQTAKGTKRRKATANSNGASLESVEDLIGRMGEGTGVSVAAQANLIVNPSLNFDAVDSSIVCIDLLRLYDRLQEDTVVNTMMQSIFPQDTGLAAKMKEAIDCEAKGEFLSAIEMYESLLQSFDSMQIEPVNKKKRNLSSNEEAGKVQQITSDLILERSIEGYHKLSSWEAINKCTSCLFEGSLDIDQMDTEDRQVHYRLADYILKQSVSDETKNVELKNLMAPHRLRSLLHLGLNLDSQDTSQSEGYTSAQLNGLLRDNKSIPALDQAAAQIFVEDYNKANEAMSEALTGFINKYTMLHPVAYNAKTSLLVTLQRIKEQHDCIFYNTQQAYIANKLSTIQNLTKTSLTGSKNVMSSIENDIIRAWNLSEPNIFDPLYHWSDIIWSRTTTLQRIGDKASCQPGFSLTSSGALHVSSMYLRSAVAAVAQGKLSAVKPLLETANMIRKKGMAKRSALTIEEVQVVVYYNKASVLRQSDFSHVESLLKKTKALLDHKESSLNQSKQSSGDHKQYIEQAIVQRIYAEWLQLTDHMEESYAISREKSCGVEALFRYIKSVKAIEDVSGGAIGKELTVIGVREKIYNALAHHSLDLYRKVKNRSLEVNKEEMNSAASAAQSVLFNNNSKKGSSNTDFTSMLAHIAIQSMIRGLSLQSNYCMERVLTLLDLIAEHTDSSSAKASYGHSREEYIQQLLNIPAWLYLRYSAQLMGSLDLKSGDVIHPIVLHIAKAYPHALHYSFRIICEVNANLKNKTRFYQLHNLLANEGIDSFIEALLACSHPELRYNDAMKMMDNMLKNAKGNITKTVKQQIASVLDDVYTHCLAQSWPLIGSKIGKYNKHFANNLLPQVNSVLGNKRENIFNKGVIDKLKELGSNAQRHSKCNAGKVSISEFSDWLADFDGSTLHIPVPSQFTALHSAPSPPDLISSIDPELLVMSSIRKPKRVCMVSHTGASYKFLVKGGEDLRNDERIEQLFSLMNQAIAKHQNYSIEQDIVFNEALDFSEPPRRYFSAEQSSVLDAVQNTFTEPIKSKQMAVETLQARTYGVIPMSTKVGMLEWVPNTIPIQAILCEEMLKDPYIQQTQPQCVVETSPGKREVKLHLLQSSEMRSRWISTDLENNVVDYHKMYRSANQSQASGLFDAITSPLPNYYLQNRLLAMSSNAETYYTLRNEFITSLAVNNAFGYILGIGDRHLENLLLDAKTGSIVYIDFGICFGMGASVLPVPEFLPMRLTKQLLGVVQPVQALPLLRQYMLKIFDCLRRDEGVLRNALEVYINDPVMDWLKGAAEAMDRDMLLEQREQLLGSASEATGSFSLSEESGASTSVLWEPMRRVNMALRKLAGEDPAALLLEDLSNNAFVQKLKSYPALESIVLESKQGGVEEGAAGGKSKKKGKGREREKGELLSVEQQVDSLLALSTDPNILVRQWIGLQPWL